MSTSKFLGGVPFAVGLELVRWCLVWIGGWVASTRICRGCLLAWQKAVYWNFRTSWENHTSHINSCKIKEWGSAKTQHPARADRHLTQKTYSICFQPEIVSWENLTHTTDQIVSLFLGDCSEPCNPFFAAEAWYHCIFFMLWVGVPTPCIGGHQPRLLFSSLSLWIYQLRTPCLTMGALRGVTERLYCKLTSVGCCWISIEQDTFKVTWTPPCHFQSSKEISYQFCLVIFVLFLNQYYFVDCIYWCLCAYCLCLYTIKCLYSGALIWMCGK